MNFLNVFRNQGGEGGGAGAAGAGAAGAGAPPAATTGGASTPPPAAAAGVGASGASASDWTSGFNEDQKAFIANKGFKASGDVIESYRNFEKLMGVPAENLLKLPAKDDDVEGWNKIHARLGRPEKPDGYKIPMPEKGGDPEFAKWAQGVFHEAGLTSKQAEKVASKFNEYAFAKQQQGAEAVQQRGRDAEVELKKDWGMAYEQNLKVVDRAAAELGLDDPQLLKLREAFGPAGAIKFLHTLSEKLGGEHTFVTNGVGSQGFNGAMSPAAAQNKINTLKGDKEWVTKYVNGDSKAKEEMDNLMRMAYPDAS